MRKLAGLAIGTIVVMVAVAEIVPRLGWPGSASGPMAAFINSIIVSVATIVGVVMYGKMRPVGARLTWGEAMLGATYAFAMFTLGYGVVPDLWIKYAEASLKWDDPARLLSTDPGTWGFVQTAASWLPFNVNYIHIRDLIVLAIYGIAIGVNLWIFPYWQNRGQKKTEVEPASDFGRPLIKEGATG